MKKLLQSLFILMFIAGTAVAQNRTITGTVTDKADGNPLPGVTVRIVSTKIGTQTSGNGKYSLSAPASATTLEFSYLGYKSITRTIGTSNVVDVTMETDAQSLSEVSITSALGITRKERSIGTAQQSLKAEDLTQTKQVDLGTALAGKIAGVQVLGGSGAKFGTSKIRIRGISSIDGGRDPLFVVDGVVVPSTSVNMDDVENLTVLKGPAATSLYGQRGDAGVVVIKSKAASKKGLGIELNHTTTIENVATLPKYQNEYGGGSSQEWDTFQYDPTKGDAPALQAMNGARYHNYQDDVSWGPKFDGLPFAPFYAWNKFDPDYAKTAPYVAQPDNIRDFYETGVQNNTNIAISQAGEKYSGRLSYTNLNQTGVSPNTKADQNRVSLATTFQPIEKLSFNSNINFASINNFNIPLDGYGTQTAGSFSQWFHRETNIKKLRNYKNPDGTFTSWNISGPRDSSPKYWDNPYTEVYENISENNTNRVFGFAQASYKLLPDLNINFTAKGNYASFRDESRVASGTLNPESYRTKQERTRENNFVLDANYKKQLGEFSFNAGAFGELRINRRENMEGTTVGGFTVPDFYNLSASKNRPLLTSNIFNKKVRSMYGYLNTGYKNFLFLDLNIRNDWSSSLPDANNSYLYGGAALSFVFSDLLPANDILSFGKATFSAGRTGSDVGEYNIYQTYSPNGFYGTLYPGLTVPNQIPNELLKPALSDAYEAGIELRFIKDRLRFNFNYYDRTSKDQIISLSLPGSTGFTSALVNAGEIKSHGYEWSLGGTPIKTKNVTWDINANFSINKNKIVSLYPGLDNFPFESFGYVGTPRINVERRVGQEWGTIIAPGIKKDGQGRNLIDDDGFPVIDPAQNLGSFVPDLTGGFTTSVSYKSFIFGASMDFQIGGRLFSVTQGNLYGSGLAEGTAGLNDKGNPKRDDVANGGGILIPGVRESDGQPNTTYVSPQDYYQGAMPYVWAEQTYKATYVKLRELSLGYTLPVSFLSKIKAQRATVSLVARNPWLIYTAIPGIDPSESAGNWIEGGQLPGTRTIGLNLKVTF